MSWLVYINLAQNSQLKKRKPQLRNCLIRLAVGKSVEWLEGLATVGNATLQKVVLDYKKGNWASHENQASAQLSSMIAA